MFGVTTQLQKSSYIVNHVQESLFQTQVGDSISIEDKVIPYYIIETNFFFFRNNCSMRLMPVFEKFFYQIYTSKRQISYDYITTNFNSYQYQYAFIGN